jgi:hypothetical protein
MRLSVSGVSLVALLHVRSVEARASVFSDKSAGIGSVGDDPKCSVSWSFCVLDFLVGISEYKVSQNG